MRKNVFPPALTRPDKTKIMGIYRLTLNNLSGCDFTLDNKREREIDYIGSTKLLKGSDRQCKVVELSMQCCGKLLSFETY